MFLVEHTVNKIVYCILYIACGIRCNFVVLPQSVTVGGEDLEVFKYAMAGSKKAFHDFNKPAMETNRSIVFRALKLHPGRQTNRKYQSNCLVSRHYLVQLISCFLP